MSSESRHSIAAADGVELAAWLAVPSGRPPLAVLVLCHGLTTDAREHGAFTRLRDRALASGLAVVRFDFRAHGCSGGSNELLRLAGERADVEAALALVDEQLGMDVPVVPVGLSFGGAAAVHAAAVRSPCAGLVLWYAVIDYQHNYGPDSPVPFTRQMRAAADPARDPSWAAMPVLGSDYHLPQGLLDEIGDDGTFATMAGLSVPVLAYHGSRDTFVGLEPLRRLAASRAGVDVRIAYGARHGFLLWRPWVVRRTVAWAVDAAARYRASAGVGASSDARVHAATP